MTYFPTNLYPKVLYSTSRTVEADFPVVAADPTFIEVGQDAVSQSGRRVSYTYRREEQRAVGFLGASTVELNQWRQFFQDHGGRGAQFELLVDRFTGGIFTFENTLTDQNLATTLNWSLTPSYTVVNCKTALVLPGSGAGYLANPVGSLSEHLPSSGGTIVVTFVPDFSSTAGSAGQTVFDSTSGSNRNRLHLAMTDSNAIDFRVYWASGSLNSVRWAAASWAAGGGPVTLIVDYTQTGSVRLWYQSIQATLTPINNAGSLTTLANTLAVGNHYAGSYHLAAKLLHLAFYKTTYDDPTVLASWFPVGRNYYDKAELMDRQWQPRRVGEGVDQWQWTWTIRQGV